MTATEVPGALHPHSYKLGALCAFSVGLATSSLGSAVILAQSNNYKQHFSFRAEVFFWSLGIGVLAILLTILIIRIFRRFRS